MPEPHREGTVILAFDVSSSMAATDLAPTRMEAAKSAARTFVERQPPTVRLGVVAFSGSGLVTEEPTADRARVLAAIDRLRPDGGTALARGLQTSLSAIVGQPVLVDGAGLDTVEPTGPDLGYHGSAAVVLLSDGENTVPPDPIDVAEIASSAGVRVYPIGLGRPEGTVLEIGGFQLATALNEPLLKEIAARTDGRYFTAADERGLAAVYDAIDLTWTVRDEHIELTAPLAAVAGLLLLGRRRAVAGLVRAGGVAMGFGWPLALLSLLAVPLLAGGYVWQLRRRRRRAVRYSSVALIRAAGPPRSAWRRHVPFGLVLAALALLGLAAARPQVRHGRAGLGVGRHPGAGRVRAPCAPPTWTPNRLSAAQAAVREFVQAQEPSTSIGLVLFSGFAQVAVAPTTDRAPVLRAIDSLTTGRGTTIGAAILKSVDAIAEINPAVAPADPGAEVGSDRPGPSAAADPARPEAGNVRAGDRRAAHRRAQHPRGGAGGRGRDRRRSRGAGVTRSDSVPATRRRWSARRPSWAGGVRGLRARLRPRQWGRAQLPGRRRGHAA